MLIFVAVVIVALIKGVLYAEGNEFIDALTSNVWIGSRIEMPGLLSSAKDVFGSDIKLTIKKYGKCSLEVQGEILKAKWRIKENEIYIRGKGIRTKGHFDNYDAWMVEFSPLLTLYDIENYMVIFFNETYFTLTDVAQDN